MIIGVFVVVCMIIGNHQKNAKVIDRWRMREFHKQKIDEATVKNVRIPSGTFWLLIFGRSSCCHSLPPPPRLHLGGGTGFETVALWLYLYFPFFFYIYVWYILLHSTRVHVSPKFSDKDPRIHIPQSQRLASASLRHSGAPHLHLHLHLALPVLLEGSAKIQIYFRWTPTC